MTYTVFADEDARKRSWGCFYRPPESFGWPADAWRKLLYEGVAAWDGSNVERVDPVIVRLLKEGSDQDHVQELCRWRNNWTKELLLKLRHDFLTVDIVGPVATISYTDPEPDWVKQIIDENRLGRIEAVITDIYEVHPRIGGIPVFRIMATSKGYWREPFRDAERFVVGRLDIDREKGSWSHVHPTLRRARNHARRLEAKREMFDIRVAENERARMAYEEEASLRRYSRGKEREDRDAISDAFG